MSPIDTITGLRLSRRRWISRAMRSDANAEPPGLFTRSTTARTEGSRRTAASASRMGSAQATVPCTGGKPRGRPSVMAPSTRITATRLGRQRPVSRRPKSASRMPTFLPSVAWTNFSIWRSSATSSTSARSLASAGVNSAWSISAGSDAGSQPARLARLADVRQQPPVQVVQDGVAVLRTGG